MDEHKIRLEYRPIEELIPYEGNAKLHPAEQIQALERSFDTFGRIVPAGIDSHGHLIYGHGRILAAQARGDKDFPCVVIDHLDETQRRAFVHADNLLSRTDTDEELLRSEMASLQAAGFDVSLAGYDPAGLQLGEDPTPFWGEVETETSEDFEAFAEKFKPRLTTDDVYTPDNIYRTLLDWARLHYELGPAPVVRPFYPGGDYQAAEYPEGCVVIDNPPFSILSEICAWYDERGIRYLLFAPGMTLFSINSGRSHYLPVGVSVLFPNCGATIAISFVTSLGPYRIELCPDLYQALDAANDENLKALHKDLPAYSYPDAVANVTLNRLCKYGQALQILPEHASFIRALDAQREAGKAIYGGGFLLSEKAAAEKAAAEKAAAEKAAAIKWPLSEREAALIAALAEADHG
jgi:hypothetical protein